LKRGCGRIISGGGSGGSGGGTSWLNAIATEPSGDSTTA